MDRHSLDYSQLSESLEKSQRKVYRLKDVEDRIERVAFDMVRFKENDTDQLWKVTESEDGPVIVALYDEAGQLSADGNGSVKEASDWRVIADADSVHVYYKSEPISRIAAKDLNIPANELGTVLRWLPQKLASDESLQSFVLSFSGPNGLSHISKTHPELKKVASAALHTPVKTKAPISKIVIAALKIRECDLEE